MDKDLERGEDIGEEGRKEALFSCVGRGYAACWECREGEKKKRKCFSHPLPPAQTLPSRVTQRAEKYSLGVASCTVALQTRKLHARALIMFISDYQRSHSIPIVSTLSSRNCKNTDILMAGCIHGSCLEYILVIFGP